MWKIIEGAIAKAWALLFLLGSLFILLAFYRVSGSLLAPTVTPGPAQLPLLALGSILFILATVIYLLERDLWRGHRGIRIVKRSDAVEAEYRNSVICIDIGKLEEKAAACSERCAVVLPINNHFEARCFDDRRIALGSFLAVNFSPTEIGEIRQAVAVKLDAAGMDQGPPYPVGTAVYIEHSAHRLIFAAVSTKENSEGVKSEISFLHSAMRQIIARIVEEEINVLYLPLMGSGKGGIPDHVALLSLLNALCESVNRSSGHHLREAHIVVLKKDKQRLNVREARRIMRTCLALWADQPYAP